MMTNYTGLSLLLFILVSCTNADVGKKGRDDNNQLYYDYQVKGDEGSDEVTVRLQYKTGGEEGFGLLLEPPSKVFLDNTPLPADSSKFIGTYYELTKPVDELKGEHTIVFIDKKKKEHREHFRFEPFSLAEELPETLPKKPFTIRLNGLPSTPTTVRLVMTDTSMQSPDVNEEMVAEDGEIRIDSFFLDKLTKGPVTLEIYREDEQPIETAGGGKLSMTYGLRRQFEFR